MRKPVSLTLWNSVPDFVLQLGENWEGRTGKISYMRDEYHCDVTKRSGGLLDGMLLWILHPPGFPAHVPNITQTVSIL